ncbi:hypothetical protein DTO013E5_4164 [Penicillium roqueforti]|uniref:BRCT domain n=1 Tax=Penicillium roqueforti (strain FM164) TaxID=1365484 RepID=W6PT81_PENRF|nr:uncharacterized protein LCP9604111_4150 [Penicillium roqueforti]CDM26961.1 BRCT domain [Penicillium roqueforti FM164]KAF9249521.1 hypothetical protein LCP9604111_4150 [Penicillium roqueforti]KAI1835061.1 hypothetical protein CBS147337_3878 [Penicillium roqueforti]KAI2677075.1 hypothetical protein CBS147355_5302 [Penicillium roqueforti]KAI2688627.1 hypothetical protein LCP963914a_3029 [Penicillium roqueforti]
MTSDRSERAAKPQPPGPQNHLYFDSWQSASTGHQHAADGGGFLGSTSWRDARSAKLTRQYNSGDCLPGRGRGSGSGLRNTETRESTLVPGVFDGQCAPHSPPKVPASGEWAMVAGDVAKRNELGVRDIRSFMGVSKRKVVDEPEQHTDVETKRLRTVGGNRGLTPARDAREMKKRESQIDGNPQPESHSSASLDLKSTSRIFAGVTVFINGSTLPRISEYKLKHLLASNGAKTSIYMARKTVTHVLVGQPNTGAGSGMDVSGAGGGLAAGKLQQEIARGGWKGVKVVSVDWALESIKAGRRLAESRFPSMHVAAKGQRSVAGMFGAQEPKK